MIYITGDLHGEIERLESSSQKIKKRRYADCLRRFLALFGDGSERKRY